MKTTNYALAKQVKKQLDSLKPTKTIKPVIQGSLPLTIDNYEIGINKLFTNSTAASAKDGWFFDRSTMIAYHRNKLT